MSYLVLARKWRPLKFADVVGQPHVSRTLLNGLKQGRVAHAYLFSGPRGVGKTTIARLVARAINCKEPQDGEPCGKCSSCEAITANRLIDIVEIDAASNRGIDNIRQLRDGINYAPIEGKAKVYIIDEVHMLTTESFNALLKTLEEPPAHAYFCLATTDPQKVPSTILSRCQRFDFRRVSIEEIHQHLKTICEADGTKYDDDGLDIVARRADGSVRDSLSLLDQVLAFSGGSATKQDAVDVVGEIRLDLYLRAIELADSSSTADAFKLDGDISSTGTDLQDFLMGLQQTIVMMLRAISMGADKVQVPEEHRDRFEATAGLFSESDLIRMLNHCSLAAMDIRRNFDPHTRMQLLFLKFAAFERSVVLQDILNGEKSNPAPKPKPARTTRSNPAPPKPKPNPAPPKSTITPETDPPTKAVAPPEENLPSAEDLDNPLETAQAAWVEICAAVSAENNFSGNMIKINGYPMDYSDGELTLRFNTPTNLDQAKGFRSQLTTAINKVIGKHRLNFEVGELPEDRQISNGDNHEEDDEAIKLLKEKLGGRVVEE